MNTLFIFAGEKSGDLHGEKIIRHLKTLHPSLQITGVGGPRMRAAGMDCVMPMEAFQVMGFVDVFFALPKLIRQFYTVARHIRSLNPDTVLFIDYPGFNLRMARHLRKKGFSSRLCHYICPSVWAWGKKRIPFMAKNLDLLLTILPFEQEYFSNTPLPVQYVGHPLVQRIKETPKQPLPLPQKTIALFPGSRKKEIERNLPIQLRTCQDLYAKDPDLFFALSVSEERFFPLIEQKVREHAPSLPLQYIPADQTYPLMQSAFLAIAKSGTVTLELALHEVPTVVTYAISPLDLFIARQIFRIRLPHYCLVNIIGKKEIFPELFGPHFTQDALSTAMMHFLQDPQKRQACIKACQQLKFSLGENDASLQAAQRLAAPI